MATGWKKLISLFLLASIPFVGSGCAFGVYMKNRYKDLCDVVSFSAGAGLGSHIQVTHYVQTGLQSNWARVRVVGPSPLPPLWFIGGEGLGMARRIDTPTGPSLEYGLAPIFHFRAASLDKDETRTILLGKTLMDWKKDANYKRWYRSDIWSFFPSIKEYESKYDRRFFDVGLSLYLGLGLEAYVNPMEVVDFLYGWFGLDISDDDEMLEEAPAQTVTRA
jgi:hypothetical protein